MPAPACQWTPGPNARGIIGVSSSNLAIWQPMGGLGGRLSHPTLSQQRRRPLAPISLT